jgi:ribonuclease E
MLIAQEEQVARVTVTVADEVAAYLSNKKRRELARLEDEGKMTVLVLGAKNVSPEHLAIECRDAESRDVKVAL